MQSKLGLVALAVAIAAFGVAVIPSTPQLAPPSTLDARIGELEDQVARLTSEMEELNTRLRTAFDGSATALSQTPGIGEPLPGGDAVASAKSEEAMKAMVDAAVDKKAQQVVDELEIKGNKKPAIDVFASMLELTDEQRRLTETEVSRGQRETYDILDIPTADGGNLMDELVDLAAMSVVWPEKDPGWGKWFVRVMTEKVPGGDETYATKIEAVKASVRESFKQSYTEEQYAEYREWGVDPIEVQKVPGSPGEELERRYLDRARQLGEQYPDGPPK